MDRSIDVSQEYWNEYFSVPPRGIFDEHALLAFAKSERDNEIYSDDGQRLKNGGFFNLVQPMTFRNNVTQEVRSWNLHVFKRWPTGSSPNTDPPTHSIEFISWILPATGEECTSRFGNWNNESEEEEKQECYAIIGAFFPPLSEYDIKEPVDD